MKKKILALASVCIICFGVATANAGSVINGLTDLVSQVTGILSVANGGTGSSSLGSTSGQVLYNNAGAMGGLSLGSTITNVSGSLNVTQPVDVPLSSTDTILSSYAGSILTCTQYAGCAVTLPSASGAGLGQGFGFGVAPRSAAGLSLTATGASLIENTTALSFNQFEDCAVRSDGTNYSTFRCGAIYDHNKRFNTRQPWTVSDARYQLTNATATATCSYFDNTGTMQYTATGSCAPRYGYTQDGATYLGALVEGTATNYIGNSSFVGASATPSTLPTSWAVESAVGLTTTIVGVGTESGMPYIDVNISGTANSTVYQFRYGFGSSAASGETWTSSAYVKQSGGVTTNLTSASVSLREVGGSYNATAASFPVDTSTLTRYAATRNWTTSYAAQFLVRIGVTNGAAINYTFRIAAPQLEKNNKASSYIKQTGTALNRAEDLLTLTNAYWLNNAKGTLCVNFATRFNEAGVVVGDSASSKNLIALTATSYGANDGTARDFNLAQIAVQTPQIACVRWDGTTSYMNMAVNGTLGTQRPIAARCSAVLT